MFLLSLGIFLVSRDSPVRKKVTTTIYITPRQSELLKTLHERTRVPVAEYIRQGIDLILEKNRDDLPEQLSLYQPEDDDTEGSEL
ncbi:MAG: ribbon-helix-helix domain-containing protein [Deltaproteobacteria bacterium]|nr:MAG: ribbon-helix-helix domain-containing protein [Deltaproteobacteria bacterium]